MTFHSTTGLRDAYGMLTNCREILQGAEKHQVNLLITRCCTQIACQCLPITSAASKWPAAGCLPRSNRNTCFQEDS
jgi:hypothetical protein